MDRKELSELTDKALLKEAKKMKSASTMSAFAIGLMAGIVIYSIVKDSFGFLMLIPMFFIYKLLSSKKNNKDLKSILKERGLD